MFSELSRPRFGSSFFLFSVALICLLMNTAAWPQSTTDGAIGGTIFDASGAVLPNAAVTARNNGTNIERTTTSDASGYYRLPGLQPAIYTVTVKAPGFAEYAANSVIVEVGRLTELSPHLGITADYARIEVTGELPEINLTSPDFAPTLNQKAVNNLPINGGRWSSFAMLTPGVVSDASGFGLLSFRGISTLLNNNTVDGADNNQAFFSEERGRTRAGYSTVKAAVQEFQINTSNYSAEYGRAAGGVINTVTKSGTNSLHGEAYFYDRDNTWGAFNPFTKLARQTTPGGPFTSVPYKPKDWRKIWGIAAGGPLVRDKVFWFFAYDHLKKNFPGTAVASSPNAFFASQTTTSSAITTLASRLAITPDEALTDYNAGITGLATLLGPTPRTGEQTIFFPKLDWQVSQKHHVSLQVNRMRWASPAGIQTQSSNTFAIASFGNDYVKNTWGVAKLDSLITSRLSNEIRYQYGRDFEFENNQTPTPYEQTTLLDTGTYTNPLGLPPQVVISTNGFTFGLPSFLQRPKYPDEYRHQIADTVTWVRGRHTLKFGGDYSHVTDATQNLRFQYGGYTYSTVVDYFSDLYGNGTACAGVPCYSSFQQAFGPLGFTFVTHDIAAFGQDDWKVMPRLSLSVGLRYEYEKLPSPILANAAESRTARFPADKNNFGPRIGFALDIRGDGKTSLRGGYGIYFGRVINSTIYNALTTTGAAGSQFSYFITPSATSPVFPRILAAQPTTTVRPSIVFFDGHFQLPQIHQVDLTLEHNLGWETIFSLSYLGSLGRQLPDFVDTNLADPTQTITYSIPNTSGPLKDATYTAPLYTKRNNTAFGSMTDIFSGVNSKYNALTAQLRHRFSRHVQFNANYTWAHALDFGQNSSTFTDTNDLLIPGNLQAEYGNSNFDVRHRFTLNTVVESPWHIGGWAKPVVNDWGMSVLLQAQTGLPYSLVTSGTPVMFVNGVRTPGLGSSINGSGGANRIDILGRNAYRYPGTYVVDLRLSKSFRLTERYQLELLGEGFNLLNHQNVTGIVNTGYSLAQGTTTAAPKLNYNPSFGSINNSNSNYIYSTRQVQVGARFRF